MNMMTTIIGPPTRRQAELAELVRRFERDEIERGVDLLIAILDAADARLIEDEPDFRPMSDGSPGTPDDAEPDAEAGGDPAFTEWLSRGRHKLYAGGWEALTADRRFVGTHEDDEDEDGHEDDDEDEDSDPGDVAHREDIYQACLHDGQAEDAEVDDPREDDGEDCCAAWEDDARRFSRGQAMGFGWDNAVSDTDVEPGTDAEPMTWPERVRQPSCMSGGLGGCDHDDYEPARVPTTLDRNAANAS